ncbi:hypothetical protein OK016_13005 [Vibrio chagasii]|nr:hypothetical protein [Vibrio chagasii]
MIGRYISVMLDPDGDRVSYRMANLDELGGEGVNPTVGISTLILRRNTIHGRDLALLVKGCIQGGF